MSYEQIYKSKLRTVDQILDMVKSGDEIVTGLGAAEGQDFFTRLHEIADRVEDVHVVTCLSLKSYEYYTDEKYYGKLFMDGLFYSADARRMHEKKMVTFIPNHLHFSGSKRRFFRKPNIYIGVGSPMDRHGNISLGTSVTYEREMLEAADIVVLEINKNVPRTFGDTVLSLRDIDYIIETDYKLPELPIAISSKEDSIIGGYIADLIEDGSTIQLGIGGIPNAVAANLENKRDLGIHTEMMTEGMVDLIKKGVVNNSKKTIHKYKTITTFALGTQKLYDFIDDNSSIEFLSGEYVNNPYTLGQNYKMVSINTTLQVDLTGQCASEAIGNRQFSGTGGQVDTATGAQMSQGGKSIIALRSTANVKNEKGERIVKSKISSLLDHGSIVTLSRNDVDYVVTEYGVAHLRGRGIRERVQQLISIAHPAFRQQLKEESERLMIW